MYKNKIKTIVTSILLTSCGFAADDREQQTGNPLPQPTSESGATSSNRAVMPTPEQFRFFVAGLAPSRGPLNRPQTAIFPPVLNGVPVSQVAPGGVNLGGFGTSASTVAPLYNSPVAAHQLFPISPGWQRVFAPPMSAAAVAASLASQAAAVSAANSPVLLPRTSGQTLPYQPFSLSGVRVRTVAPDATTVTRAIDAAAQARVRAENARSALAQVRARAAASNSPDAEGIRALSSRSTFADLVRAVAETVASDAMRRMKQSGANRGGATITNDGARAGVGAAASPKRKRRSEAASWRSNLPVTEILTSAQAALQAASAAGATGSRAGASPALPTANHSGAASAQAVAQAAAQAAAQGALHLPRASMNAGNSSKRIRRLPDQLTREQEERQKIAHEAEKKRAQETIGQAVLRASQAVAAVNIAVNTAKNTTNTNEAELARVGAADKALEAMQIASDAVTAGFMMEKDRTDDLYTADSNIVTTIRTSLECAATATREAVEAARSNMHTGVGNLRLKAASIAAEAAQLALDSYNNARTATDQARKSMGYAKSKSMGYVKKCATIARGSGGTTVDRALKVVTLATAAAKSSNAQEIHHKLTDLKKLLDSIKASADTASRNAIKAVDAMTCSDMGPVSQAAAAASDQRPHESSEE